VAQAPVESQRRLIFSSTGVGLRLLDDQPLVMDVDRPPSQLAQLGHAEASFGHNGDHRAAADPTISPFAPVHLASGCEQLD
jgi:hypothetical protein